ncbi:Protein of unknown function [Novosphingobium sp. CF614]|uniref:antitoxin Xre/MbcA/ParS toxin-binding domain-containing protein n=1 Tax=Novosphingobium sp. CF614 TaxID=1884364 RepID=UPI0008EB3DBD|nr:antitoxin Xre/MbcA/ParS toxin-binding domain-containing protein [Novosphingobium sp. CF614]SFG03307.1 Protein of unknown function [Novosphingobium sp. CF614]
MSDTDEETSRPPAKNNYFRRSNKPKLPPDAARRQGLVTKLALETLGNKEEAIAYLNLDSIRLGGRPLDLAISTVEGFRQVELDLAAIGSGNPQSTALGN